MNNIIVDIAAMWPEETCLPVLEIETETEDNISTHLEGKMTWILDGIDKDQINNCITIPIGWKGWFGDGRKGSKVNRKRKEKGRNIDEGGREKKIRERKVVRNLFRK